MPRDAEVPGSVPADAAEGNDRADIGRLFKHSSVYALGGMLNRVGVFLLLPIYTTYLSVAQYGELELFYATSSVASGLLSAGLAHATLRFYFEYEGESDRNAVVSTNLVLGTLLALAGAMAIIGFRGVLAQAVFGSTAAATGIAIIATTMVLELSTQICIAFVRAREASGFFLAVVLTRLFVQVSVNTYTVVFLGAGVHGVLAGNCIAVGVGWLLVGTFTLRRCGVRVDRSKAGPVLRYSLPFVGSTVVALVAANIDRFFIRKLLSLEALGLFALAVKFSRLLQELVGEPFSRAYGAFRFSIMHQDNAAAIQARVVRLLLAAIVFVGLGIQFFAADVLRWLSDQSFHAAAALLPPLLLASVARVVTYPLQTGILIRRETRQLFWINLFDASLYIVSSVVLIVQFGIFGACVAMATTSLVVMLVTGRVAHPHFPVTYEWDRIARVVLIAAGAFFAGLPFLGVASLLAVAAKVVVLLAFLTAVYNSGAVDPEERALVREWLASKVAARPTPNVPVTGQRGA